MTQILNGKQIVEELVKLNYFDLTDQEDIEEEKEYLEVMYDKYKILEGKRKNNSLEFMNYRFISIDSESIEEEGGFGLLLDSAENIFEKIGLNIDITNEVYDYNDKSVKFTLDVNGRNYVALDKDVSGLVGFVNIINSELILQNIDAQFYPVEEGEDGKIVLLTFAQFEFVKSQFPNIVGNPKTLEDWKILQNPSH